MMTTKNENKGKKIHVTEASALVCLLLATALQWQPHFTTTLLYFATVAKQAVFPLLLFHLSGASDLV